jgi:hypothetical protein
LAPFNPERADATATTGRRSDSTAPVSSPYNFAFAFHEVRARVEIGRLAGGGLESSLWDSSGTHLAIGANKNPRFTGVLGADDGTRTHDLLHGKRVVGSLRLSCYAAWLCGIFLLGKVRVSSQIGAGCRQFLTIWAANAACCPNVRRSVSDHVRSRYRLPSPVTARLVKGAESIPHESVCCGVHLPRHPADADALEQSDETARNFVQLTERCLSDLLPVGVDSSGRVFL